MSREEEIEALLAKAKYKLYQLASEDRFQKAGAQFENIKRVTDEAAYIAKLAEEREEIYNSNQQPS